MACIINASTSAGLVQTADTSGVLEFQSNGVQIGTLCRAWVNFNGTGTPAIRASFNVSSITDNGTGDYTINFTTAMPDVNYSWSAGGCDSNDNFVSNITPTYKTNTSVQLAASLRIQTFFNSRPTGADYNNGVADLALVCVSVMR
jgi:hypothetical protein